MKTILLITLAVCWLGCAFRAGVMVRYGFATKQVRYFAYAAFLFVLSIVANRYLIWGIER